MAVAGEETPYTYGNDPPASVEVDPTRRYWRFDDVLGRGAFKTVFKAFDGREGIEVAWNKVALGGAVQEEGHKSRLFAEISVLKRLKHKNIMTFYDYWLDEKSNTLNFITELFTDGSLRKFRMKHKHLELKVVKKWAWQILQGLVYLHGHDPPIIHRDLKCDNIFINGVSGVLKIGDLGLATLYKGLTTPHSVLGTPEFMAPEFYNENYDEKVDVYAFGMLLLELVAMEYPYCECTNPAAIYRKVSQGVYPGSLQKVRTEELRNFIELCIHHEPEERLAARKLLKHPFFDSIRSKMDPRSHVMSSGAQQSTASSAHSSEDNTDGVGRRSVHKTGNSDDDGEHHSQVLDSCSEVGSEHSVGHADEIISHIAHFDHSFPPSLAPWIADSNHPGQNFSIQCSKADGNNLFFSLRFDEKGGKRIIQFPFNLNDDTADQIVAEMLEEHSQIDLCITNEEAELIGQLISEEVERSRKDGTEGLTAYVNVQRAIGDASDVPEPAALCATSPNVHCGGPMENLVKDFIGTFQLDQTNEEEIVRSLSTSTENILDAVMNKGEGMLGGCFVGRSPGYLPIIRESPPGSNVSPNTCDAASGRRDSRDADDGCYSNVEEFPKSDAMDIHSSLSSRKRHTHASPQFLKTSFSSPPCLSRFASHSDKSSITHWHRGRSETPELPDDHSPSYDRILSGRMSGYQFSDGAGLKASFRAGSHRSDDQDDFHGRNQDDLDSCSAKISPRSDGAYTSSVALLLLQQRKCVPEEQELEVTIPRFPELAGRSSDGRMTAISMFTLKPQVSNGCAPGQVLKRTDDIVDCSTMESFQDGDPTEPPDDCLFPYVLPSCSSEGPNSHLSDNPARHGQDNACGTDADKASVRQTSTEESCGKHQEGLVTSDVDLMSSSSGFGMDLSGDAPDDVRVASSQNGPVGSENSDLSRSDKPSQDSTHLPLGSLERPATPPLIGAGRVHLLENTQTPSEPRNEEPANSLQQTQPADLPSACPSKSVLRDVDIPQVSECTGGENVQDQNVCIDSFADHEPSSPQGMCRNGGTCVARNQPSEPPRLVPMIRNCHSSHLSFDTWARDTMLSPGLPSSISSPSLADRLASNRPFMRSPDQLFNCQFGEGNQAGSSRSNSPFEDPTSALLTSQKALQKIADREQRHKLAEQKRKEMETKQLESLKAGFGGFRVCSMNRAKPIRPAWNG